MIDRTRDKKRWISRILISAVLLINLQCAIVFLWQPEAYSAGFELGGAVGAQTVRGIGLLFLMWNVPYAVAAINPEKHRVSLYEAIAMQAIGLSGEILLLWTLPPGHQALQGTLGRFIFFDGGGLIALLLAAWVTPKPQGN